MIKEIFPIKIYKKQYPGNLQSLQEGLIPKLNSIFEETKKNNQGSMRYGGLCSYNVCNNLSERIEIFDLLDFVKTEVKLFWKELNYIEDDQSKLQSWANIYPPGSYIDAHNHSPVSLTACFYLQKPENSGNIIFENPLTTILKHQPTNALLDLDNYDSLFDREIQIKEGELIIFPGWLTHKTSVNNSKENRIIIGFNVIR